MLARMWMFAGSTPLFTVDSQDYLSTHPQLFSLAFFSGHKPWFVPLFWRLVGGDVPAGLWSQLLLSVAAWLWLTFEVQRSVSQRALRAAAVAGPLLLSLTPVVAQWDATVLSESLSLSIGAAVVALLLRLVRQPSRLTAVALVATSLCWAGTRDTNTYVLLAALPACGLVTALRSRRRLGFAVAIAAVGLLGFSMWSSSSPRRWELISVDLVNERVLGDPAALSYFKAHGMPTPPDLRTRMFSERVPFSRFQRDPKLATFRHWLLADSRSTYIGYLRTHPHASLVTPLKRIDELNSANAIRWYRPAGFRDLLPNWSRAIAYIPAGSIALIWSLIACAIALALLVARFAQPGSIIGAVLVLFTIPQAILVWDAEPREVGRHALLVGVLDRLGLALLVVFILDALLRLRRDLRPTRAIGATA
jgi:hypothetical protein